MSHARSQDPASQRLASECPAPEGARVRAGHPRLPRAAGLLALLALLLLPGLAGGAFADDEAPDAPPPLKVEVFRVGALTAGWSQFLGEVPPPVSPDEVTDEEHPLFGAEAEEPRYPLGQVDELIEIILGHVDPASWEVTDGAYMAAIGESQIFAQHRPEVLAQVANYLAELEARLLRTATVEVFAEQTAADEEPEGDHPTHAVSLTGFQGQRVSAFSGRRYAYLQDYAVEVAQGASISKPIVGVANVGLGVDARILPGGDARRVTVDLDIRLSLIEQERTVGVGLSRNIDAPVFRVVTVRDVLDLVPGRWTELSGHGGEGGWAFHVRVTPGQPRPAAAVPGFPGLPARAGGEMAMGMLDVGDLQYPVPSVRRSASDPFPSNFTPPESPELPEPSPGFSPDHLVELLRTAAPPGVWDDPASIEVRNGRMIARNAPNVLAGIGDTLAYLRREFCGSLTTRVDVVEMPSRMLDELRHGAAGATVLTPAQVKALDQALEHGRARRLDRLELSGRGAVMNTIQAGRKMQYVRDYDVMIAQQAQIGNPVVGQLFSGLRLAVTPNLASGGRDVALDVRFRAARQPATMRRVQTPVGNLELPDVDVLRVRTALFMPLDGTALLGAQGNGETSRVLLLRPRLRGAR